MVDIDWTHLDADSNTLSPIPHDLHAWMIAFVVLGFISFVSSVLLFLLLAFRLTTWYFKSRRTNQFVILIFNLVWADIQQSLAFLLDVAWVRKNSIDVKDPICFASGWLISTGDVASGMWCFAIGLHTFSSVILDFRLKPNYFFAAILITWVFIYGVSAIPVGILGKNAYVRAGVWCWIHHDLSDLRLWTHYVWIFFCEFGNVIIYAIIYTMLIQRLRSGYYSTAEATRVKAISNLMVFYPMVYVFCTIPLASARMASMSGFPPSLKRLCLSGAMITSNGWLDVVLYTLTRKIMIFSDEPPPDDNGIDTFSAFWAASPKRFGAATTCEADRSHHRALRRGIVTLPASYDSENNLCGLGDTEIKMVTTTHITSEPANLADYEEMEAEARRNRPRTPTGRYSEESAGKEFHLELEHIPDD